MQMYTNRQLITQSVLDSGALGLLGAVVHQFAEPGEYHGAVLQDERERATFLLAVEEGSTALQVDVDLGALSVPSAGTAVPDPCLCKDGPKVEPRRKGAPRFTVGVRGYTLFYSSIAGAFSVRVNRVGEERVLFDSRELQDGDLFAATLIRPGSYAVTNVPARSQGGVLVAYPEARRVGEPPPAPVTIDATSGALTVTDGRGARLDRLAIQPGQGQIYRIRTPSRIRLELVEPDDGPGGRPAGGVTTWRRQRGPQAQPRAPRRLGPDAPEPPTQPKG